MLVYREIARTLSKPLYLAVGNFDGVHLGHQKILSRVTEDAQKNSGLSAVLTFSEHPRKVLNSGAPHLLHSLDQKLFYLAQAGVDICFLLDFTPEFSKLEAAEFAKKILADELKVKKVFLGYNARFGHDRKGDGALMKQLAAQHGFEFESVPPVNVDGEPVSSSRIRALVEKGDFKHASACLGRAFTVFAPVIHGDGRGTGLGYPTANFETDGRVLPPQGVYPAAIRRIEKREQPKGRAGELTYQPEAAWHPAAANCGTRPTFEPGSSKVVLEAFVLDYPGGDLYGKLLEVYFYPSLRPEKAFSSLEELKRQIALDVEASRQQFLSRPPLSSAVVRP